MQKDVVSKPKNVFYITHNIELLFWLCVIFVVVLCGTLYNLKLQKNDNDYNIFMQDVDGLIVGSPVRMMGIEVGYITEIKPTNTEVFVKFVINDNNIQIPQGTEATVEFTGMAGSKSLELYLPDTTKKLAEQTNLITVNSPKRLHDALGLLNDMFDKLGSIIFSVSAFGEKLNKNEITQGGEIDFQTLIEYSNDMLNDTNNKINDLDEKIQKLSKNLMELKK